MKIHTSQKGLSIVEVVVAMSLLLLLVITTMGLFTHIFKAREHISWRGELEDVRNMVRKTLDCDQTIAHNWNTCWTGTGGWVSGRRPDGAVLFEPFPQNSPVFGDSYIVLRAHCTPLHTDLPTQRNGFQLLFQYARTLDANDPNPTNMQDPLNRRIQSWTPLFPPDFPQRECWVEASPALIIPP